MERDAPDSPRISRRNYLEDTGVEEDTGGEREDSINLYLDFGAGDSNTALSDTFSFLVKKWEDHAQMNFSVVEGWEPQLGTRWKQEPQRWKDIKESKMKEHREEENKKEHREEEINKKEQEENKNERDVLVAQRSGNGANELSFPPPTNLREGNRRSPEQRFFDGFPQDLQRRIQFNETQFQLFTHGLAELPHRRQTWLPAIVRARQRVARIFHRNLDVADDINQIKPVNDSYALSKCKTNPDTISINEDERSTIRSSIRGSNADPDARSINDCIRTSTTRRIRPMYTLVKLDIDQIDIEKAVTDWMVGNLIDEDAGVEGDNFNYSLKQDSCFCDDESLLSLQVSEFLWEHHMYNYLMLNYWGFSELEHKSLVKEGLELSYRKFLTFREKGIRAHSWI